MDTFADNTNVINLLSDASKAFLLENAKNVEAQKGELLISRGDAVSGVFLVQQGALRVYAMNEDGKQATLYRLKEGELCLLSLNSSLTGGRYPGWVSVESQEAKVLSLQGSCFRSLFSTEQAIQNLMLTSLTSTISYLLLCIDEALLSDLQSRLVSFLTRNRNAKGEITMTHQEIADHLGVTRESISRELSLLQSQNRIRKKRNCITLIEQ